MKKVIKILALALFTCLMSAQVVQAKVICENVKAGENSTWTLTDDGVMRFQGTGSISTSYEYSKNYDKFSLVKQVIVEEGITSITECTMASLDNAESISLPNSLKQLKPFALSSMDQLTSVTIPNHIQKLPKGIFENNKKLTKVVLPKGIKSIGEGAFQNCKSLKNLTLSESVKNIGENAFGGCDSLVTVVLPKNLKTMEDNFSNAKALTKIVNRSKKILSLSSVNGRRVWKVNGKKVLQLLPGKTATTAGVKYKLSYYYSGGKAKGKMPKYYYFGKTPKLPKATKKGYKFLGWLALKGNLKVPEKFPRTSAKDLSLTAIFVKVKVTRISPTKVRISVEDSVDWNVMQIHHSRLHFFFPRYVIRVNESGVADKKLAPYHFIDKNSFAVFDGLDPNKQYNFEITFSSYYKKYYEPWVSEVFPTWYQFGQLPQ